MIYPQKISALGLCSGGLDSILAALILQKQKINVQWISFETPFFSSENAKKAAELSGIHLCVKNITDVYLKMLKNPDGGYGKYMNPCRDCHALMFNIAGKIMEENGFDFLFSGEVTGQRPFSQAKSALRYVEKRSGYDGYILRPLSAKCLPETIPEKEGKVNRAMLLDFSGKTRTPQIKLALEMGVINYPTPGGGCLLTDKGYSIRLRDLFEHQINYMHDDLYLLKYGRHLRLNCKTKLIIGRNALDNKNIMKYYNLKYDTLIGMKNLPGPVTLMKNSGREDVLTAASICAGYSKASMEIPADVQITTAKGSETVKVIGKSPLSVQKIIL